MYYVGLMIGSQDAEYVQYSLNQDIYIITSRLFHLHFIENKVLYVIKLVPTKGIFQRQFVIVTPPKRLQGKIVPTVLRPSVLMYGVGLPFPSIYRIQESYHSLSNWSGVSYTVSKIFEKVGSMCQNRGPKYIPYFGSEVRYNTFKDQEGCKNVPEIVFLKYQCLA